MLYKRRCNAGKRGRRGRKRGGGERKRGKGNGLGRSSRANRHGVLYPRSPAPDSARSTDTSQFGICDPTYSPFSLSPSHKHRSRSIYPYTPFSTQFLFSSFTIISLSLSVPLPFARYLSLQLQLIRCSALLPNSLGTFSPSYLSSISPHEPYLHEAVPPRCFNHLYLFHFSALFFLIPSDQTGEAFISTPYPLICAAMHPAFPRMPHPITFVYPLQSLTQPKRA
ncbi:hypothetical protein EDB92DRAFT_1424027 [Lactarius akahatsu]|uniref:Uncharacterized protein n=1 Tax=Lactarius akahatsu TaxID=416441 RepID=A0AAD4LNY8_9AGAM|nr:hypothetical protein EDB92DRAFT_1424027 [Lactarius akahatsu]